MNFLVLFIILSLINVIFSTIRSITTIKSGWFVASLMSAGYFAFYNIMLLYTVSNFPMWEKCIITFCCNFIGVSIVKIIEKKREKDKMWLVKMTVPTEYYEKVKTSCITNNISNSNYFVDRNYAVFDCYCKNREETSLVKKLCNMCNGKMFATENILF